MINHKTTVQSAQPQWAELSTQHNYYAWFNSDFIFIILYGLIMSVKHIQSRIKNVCQRMYYDMMIITVYI